MTNRIIFTLLSTVTRLYGKIGAMENYDIYMYNISTHKVTQITTNGKAYNPAIYGDRIVWENYRLADESHAIYMYDLSTHKETKISTSGRAYNSAIYGDKIVWQDYRNGNDDIYLYDISISREIRITTNKSEQEFPAIYGDRVVWQDYRNVNYSSDIYMGTIRSPLVAIFYASPISGKAPLTVKFTDKSTGSPTSWTWSFGDRTTNSTVKNPVHTYNKTGKYNVSLTVKNAAGSNTATKTSYIVVNVLKAPVAAFYAPPISEKAPLTVTFTDKSTGSPTSWSWNFGDKSTSTAKNPVHKYSKAGKYTVSLTVKNAAGSNSITKSGYITVK